MYCHHCGKQVPEDGRFCSSCGEPLKNIPRPHHRLMRSRTDKKIAGVCGGLADYLDVDPTIVRVVAIMLALLGGWGVLGYVVAWAIVPEEQPDLAHSASPASV